MEAERKSNFLYQEIIWKNNCCQWEMFFKQKKNESDNTDFGPGSISFLVKI